MTIVDNAIYKDGKRILAPTSLQETFEECERLGGMAWVGLYRPDEAELQEVAEELNLHELAVEDALAGGQRAKLEHYDDDRFFVLIPARYIDETETVEFGELNVFVGANFVVTVRHSEVPDLSRVRLHLERDRPERLAAGTSAVVHGILDTVVDDYFPVADGLDNDIAEIEDQIFAGDGNVSRRIYQLSREVVNFQRAIRSLPYMLDNMIENLETDPSKVEVVRKLRDVQDHTEQLNDRVMAMRTMLEHALELDSTLTSKKLAEESVRQNDQVKKISSWAAIIFAPQLIGSIYGMNFDRMPELHWAWGYPFALGLMLAIAVVLYVLFRRNDWL
ncbi:MULTISPECIES: magnesium and cobalt transport protein CorA [Micrococcaceae]|uniref:magnesium and cobalt transport protein CorA n=1 Tax=Micrococcaceae TaxID=1268 RepID=UPI001616A462|nr:magnesium and cobalt transport protein CorA [Citricoccus sp.]MBB5750442.1 magnesium transporter [Micrococcus sp. TA1]HRO29705.1 magnesium and cobalt transport protein CorA [Citricoccus sp.]HRO93801.1 magnesium and cobalt transport protein CorA [Citricoccus sp.]